MAAPKGNQYAKGNNGGRPPKFPCPREMERKIDEYFAKVKEECAIPTMAGLCLTLGFKSRNALFEYKEKEEFADALTKATMSLMDDREKRLISKDAFTPGVIFDLKNNYGWKDKQEVEHTVNEEAFNALDRRLAKAKDAAK